MPYYVVRKGKTPGIYTSWAECKKEIEGFTGAEFRKFESQTEAQNYLNGAPAPRQKINPATVNATAVANSNVKYSFIVKNWMTHPTELNSDFTFMSDWNNNRPMPSTHVNGFKIRETKGMVYIKCQQNAVPYTPWEGWVIKSAIISEKQIGLFECSGPVMQPGLTPKSTKLQITVLIYRNNRNEFALKITFSRPSPKLARILVDKYKARQQDDIFFYTYIEHYEDILDDFASYPITVDNPEEYDYIKVHEYDTSERIVGYPEANWKTKPYSHQLEAYEFGMSRSRFLIADQQGLGKSMESIVIAEGKKRHFGYKHCLVICGVNTLKWNWMNEIQQHSDEKGRILGFKKKNVGDAKAKLKDLENIDEMEEYFIITNVETLRNVDIFKKLKELCDRHVIDMIIVDEFHKCKNTQSLQGKHLSALKAETMIALTGTPILNNPLDLYGCFKWLGYEKKSKFSFDKYYSKRSGSFNEIVTYRHMDTMQKNLQHIMLRRKKEDVLDLPPKIYKDEYVEMSAKQKKLYEQIYDETIQNIGEIEMSKNPLSKMTRLRQATAHAAILDPEINEGAKIDRLKELIEDYVEDGKKVIVFSEWTKVTDLCMEALKKYNPLSITGATDDAERIKIKDAFQNDPERKVIIGTTGAMGTGLTLTAAEAVIFMDEPWTDGQKEQAVDRAHRIGTKSTVNVHTLICKDTIDEKIHMIVGTKKGISDLMVDNNKENVNIARILLGLEELSESA